jgi:hypothetical protein
MLLPCSHPPPPPPAPPPRPQKVAAAAEAAANGPKGPTEVNRSAEALAARAAKFAAPGTKHAPVVAPIAR